MISEESMKEAWDDIEFMENLVKTTELVLDRFKERLEELKNGENINE